MHPLPIILGYHVPPAYYPRLTAYRGSLGLNQDTEPHPEMCRLAEVLGWGLFP